MNRPDKHSIGLSGVNLSGIDLSGTDLSDVNLKHADLSGSDLTGANLSGSDLTDVDLSDCILTAANLSGVKLKNADLSGMDLNGINLKNADLRGTDLSLTNLSNGDLRGICLKNSNSIGSSLRGANLSRADLRGANFESVDAIGANLNEADLSGANLSNADLVRVTAKGANFTGSILTGATLENWQIDDRTIFENVICDYVYLKSAGKERRPQNKNKFFQAGEFVELLRQPQDPLNLTFKDGIDWKAFIFTFEKLQQQLGDRKLSQILSIEIRRDLVIVKIALTDDFDKQEIKNYFQKKYEEILKNLAQQYHSQLNLQAREIDLYLRQNCDVFQTIKYLAHRPLQPHRNRRS